MQRMTHKKSKHNSWSRFSGLLFLSAAVGLLCTCLPSNASAQVVHADYDFDASGFVSPAGMAPPQQTGGVIAAGYYPGDNASSGSCDGCDSAGCSGGCDSMGGSGAGGIFGSGTGGLFGGGGGMCGSGGCGLSGLACGGCRMPGCGLCARLSGVGSNCLFCRGAGCSACQLLANGGLFGMGGGKLGLGGVAGLMSLFPKPHAEGGLCRQRWYDASAELMFLGHTSGSGGFGGFLTSQGVAGPGVLSVGDANGGELETGFRVSGALMFGGAGANIEATWVGDHDWDGSASVSDIPGAGLFSFISEFGTVPLNGFDDTDRSLTQSVDVSSEYDSVELNYRRRAVWPYCRFQSSWLIGMRYIRYDDGLIYSALGENNNTVNSALPRFFSSDDRVQNKMFGGQAGGDFLWNINPGVSFGLGLKLGILNNDSDRVSVLTANSLDPLATPGTVTVRDGIQDTTFMSEFEAKLIYRLSHSWTYRMSYYNVAVEDVNFGTIDVTSINRFVQAQPVGTPGFTTESLVVQGFSVGLEYVW